ncbi:hypothetical protein [Actinophytocola sp.]|uniref:hypothetical protein n=1 Tax=Actinophytocola sp. TaxID=1872138 RepID=UPI002ED4D2BD
MSTNASEVEVLDLRVAPGDPPVGRFGRLVVLDDADSLVKHADTYLALVSGEMVSAVVCVAIGEADGDDRFGGAVLAIPHALRYATVLWVGDREGVRWVPDGSHPRPVEADEKAGDSLDDLIAALRVPHVFDRVVEMAEGHPGMSPAVRVAPIAPDPVELVDAGEAAVQALTAPEYGSAVNLGPRVRRLDSSNDHRGNVLAGRIHQTRDKAVRALNRVTELTAVLGTGPALLGRDRPTARLGEEVARAGQLAEEYRECLALLLDRVDGHLRVGTPPVAKVTELGVPTPRAARLGEIVPALREVVTERLARGTSLTTLAEEIRLAAATSEPQGCGTDLAEVRGRGPLSLGMPAFRRWPISRALLPVVAVCCALLTILLGPGSSGWVGGGLLAAGWFASGLLLLARRPGPAAEHGLATAWLPAVGTYGVAAVAGVAGGALAPDVVLSWVAVPELVGGLLAVGVSAVSAATVVLSWRAAVRAWSAGLRVADVRTAIEELTRRCEEAVGREWLPVRRHRAIAATAGSIAVAIEELSATLGATGGRVLAGEWPDPPDEVTPAVPELLRVVHADLADLCRAALAPAWQAAEGGRRLDRNVLAKHLVRRLGDYGDRVRRHGLLAAGTPGDRRRDALVARLWADSPLAAVALRTGPGTELVQLCRGDQVRYLSTAVSPGLLRFAPGRLRGVLERSHTDRALASDPGITWSDGGELVGALRLVPLRPESVHHMMGSR